MIPRFRGKVGQTDDPEFKDKWFFTVWLSMMGEGEGREMGTFGPWDTEEIALRELKKCVRHMVETYEKEFTGKISGNYIDMQTNENRSWDEN